MAQLEENLCSGDFSDAIIYALDNFNTMPLLLNIGTGVDNTIDEYYSMVAELMGYEGSFVYNINAGWNEPKLVSIEKQTKWGWRVPQ